MLFSFSVGIKKMHSESLPSRGGFTSGTAFSNLFNAIQDLVISVDFGEGVENCEDEKCEVPTPTPPPTPTCECYSVQGCDDTMPTVYSSCDGKNVPDYFAIGHNTKDAACYENLGKTGFGSPHEDCVRYINKIGLSDKVKHDFYARRDCDAVRSVFKNCEYRTESDFDLNNLIINDNYPKERF